ncbi:MAG: hypothetical protein ABIP35_03685, partial [Ginsengibacter sp.]
LSYYHNKTALGTPENWNESIRKANGTWIKLMHDDDWFADENSLQLFYEATLKRPDCSFIFSAYNNVAENKKPEPVFLSPVGKYLLQQNPLNIFKKQYVGNPSCTLIKNDVGLFYDKQFKWVVDFEYYIRCLQKLKSFYYINIALVNVGINETQVTQYSFRNPEIEIPENHLMVEKMSGSIFRNIFVYDHYWRLYRNLDIRSSEDIIPYYSKPIHPLLRQMIAFQKMVPTSFLKIGIFSKLFMLGSYLVSLFRKS